MSIVDRFKRFAADFEKCVSDDEWSRLEEYFAPDATYLNVGGPDPTIRGRTAILDYLRSDVSNIDRQFDSRELQAVTQPTATGNRLSRKWRCTYKLSGAPDLIAEGEARYEFDGELIRAIEEELTPESMRDYIQWMEDHGHRLHG